MYRQIPFPHSFFTLPAYSRSGKNLSYQVRSSLGQDYDQHTTEQDLQP